MVQYINIRLVLQFMLKRLRVLCRYPVDTISMLIRPIITLIPYIIYLLTKKQTLQIDTLSSITYVVIAYFFAMNISSLIITYNHNLLSELQQGTYGLLQLSPIHYNSILFSNVLSIIMINLLIGNGGIIIFHMLGIIRLSFIKIIVFEFSYISTSIIAFNISVVLSYFTIKFGEVRITYFVNSVILLLAGITYPISIYPVWLKRLALISPITVGLELIKDITSGVSITLSLKTQITYLLVSLVIWGLISQHILMLSIKQLKKNGCINI